MHTVHLSPEKKRVRYFAFHHIVLTPQ